ncbi:hypothetical protein OROMI_001648 [Orobanche minor]
MPSQEILKIRDDTPLETEEILTYIKVPSNKSVWHFSSNLDVPTNVVQRKRVARILFFKIRPSQEILKIRDGTPMEAEEILIYIKSPQNKSVWHFSSNLYIPSNVVQKKRVARIMFFKIRPSQEILKIRDGTPMEAEEILIYIKKPSKKSVWHFSSNLDVPSNVVQKKIVARILFFKIRPSQEILKIRDGTPLEAEEILIYIKKPSNKSVWHFSSNLDVPINVVQKKRVARILFSKIRPSQEILKIRDGTPLEAEEILIHIKKPSNKSVWHFSSKLDILSNVVQKKRVARILFFKIRPSQEILKIRHGTPLETEEILTYIKSPQNRSFWHFYSNLDVPSNVVHKKRVARNLFIKIRPSQEILKIRDGTSLEMEEILTYIKKPSKQIEILKIRHGTPLETEEILTYIKSPQNRSFWHFYSNLDVPSNVVQKKRVARILFFKIRPSQEILKIRDVIFNLDVPTNVVQRKRVARILFFKIRPSQEILKIRDGTPMEAEEILIYIKSPQNKSVWHFSSNLYIPSNVVQKKRVARIMFFKIRPSQEILKIRDGTPMEAEEILIYIKKPSKKSVWHFSSNLDVPSNVVQKKIVARILFFKIRPSQEILKIRDGTPLEAEEILIYIKKPSNKSVWHFSSNLDVPINVVQKKRVARILFSKIRPSQEILKIRDGTPLEAEEILIHIKKPSNKSVWHFSSKLDILSNVVQKKRVARILFFKIRPSQEILKIRHGTPLETEEILTYIKSPQNRSFWHFYSNLDVPSNVVHKKRVARNLFIKIRPSQEILKIRDGTSLEMEEILTYIKKPSKQIEILKIRHGTPLETEEILTYIKSPQNRSFWHFYSNLDVPSNVVQKKRVARILFFKIRPSQEILKIRDEPSQEILKIRDDTPLETEEILTYIKDNLDVPTNVVQRKRVARILFFKIRPSQEILKIRDGTPMEAEEILIYIKSPQNKSVWHFSSNLYIPSNVVQKKRVARIMFFKIRPSQEILKIRDGTPMEAEEILIYIKKPSKKSVWHFSSNLDVPSNVVQKKIVARILFFKIRPSQEILKIRDGTPLEAEEILIYIKKPSNKSVWHFSSNLDVPINVVQKKRVARILFSKIRPSQEILKIRDGTPLEAEEILIHIKKPSNKSVWHFSSKLDILSNVVQKKRVARILFFKIRPSQEILKIRHGTPLETEEILTYIKSPQNRSFWHFYSNLDVPSNVVHKKRVARNLFIKIRPSQEILKIRDGTSLEMEEILTYIKKPSKQIEILKIRHGTPLETEEILTYIKSPQNRSFWHFYSNLDVPSNVVQKKRVARILFFKIRPSQEILKIRDDVPTNVVQRKRVAHILFFKIRPSQEILKIRDGTPMEAEEILIYIKSPQNKSVWHFSSNLYVPSNVVQKKRVARIMFFKIRPSQEILKIRDGTPMEAEEILIYIKSPQRNRPSQEILKIRDVARILFFKIRPSQEILKIRDGTPLEAEEILIHIKKPSNKSVWHFSSKLDILSNVVQKKRVARILFFKIRPSQEILKIRHGTPLETEEILTYIKSPQNRSFWHFYSNLDVPSNVVHKKRVARNLFIKIRPSQEILKIRHGTPLETEEILTYIKSPQNRSFWHFYSNLDVPSNVVQKKRVARILFFKIRPSQEILKIRDVQNKRVARILVFKIRPSQEILKIRHGTPLETEEILTYIKSPQNRSFWHFYSNLDVPSNVVQKKRVARILFFKIRPSQEILKIRHGTPLETEEILTYIKSPQNRSFWHFYSNLDVPSNVVQKKRVARILFFKIRPSQEILKIRDDMARNLFIKIRPSQEILKIRDEILKILMSLVQKKIVAQILFFKIRPSQEILKIRDGTPLEAEEILIYIKKPSNKSVWHFSSNLDVPINVVQKKRVARILFSKIRPSQEILKIRDGTPLEAEEILIHIKKPSNKSVWHFSSKLDILSNVVQKKRVARILVFKIRPSQEILIIRDGTPLENKRVARILVFKIRPSQEILKIRHGTPLETEEILTYIKSPQNRSFWHFYSNLDVPSNVVQKKRVARILFFKIRPSQEILKIRHGTPLETEEILTYIKSPQNRSFWHFYSNLDVPSNVVQKKRVARILFFKIRPSQEILKIRDEPSQEILKIRDDTPLETEEILTYIKDNLDVPTNVVQRKRVARILFFKIRPSQEILKIRDGTPMEAEEILIYIKSPQNKSVWHFSSNLYIPSNVVQKKRVARIMFFKIRPSQEILKIRDGTPMEAEEILIYIKKPSKKSVWHFSSNLDVPSNVVQKKIVARILFFKIRPSQEILKIRDGTPLEAEEILIYIKKPSNKSVWHFSSNLDVPINVVQKKRVARILFSKIRPSQEILKIRDGTPLEAEEILIHIKKPSNKSVWHFSSKLDILSNVVQKKRVARILFFKIRPSQEILKIRHGTPLETEEILTYIKSPQNRSFWHFYSNLDVPSNVVHKKRVARNLFIKIRPSQEILKIRDGTSLEMEEILTYIKKPSKQIEILKIRHGTPLETEEILTYIKSPQNRSFWHFYSNLDVPSNVVQKKRVARILFFKIRPSQEILKIRDDVPTNVVQRKRVAHILFFKIRPSQEILKIRDGTPMEAEEILIYIKSPQNKSVWHFSSNLYVPSNVVQKKRVARIMFFKIRPSQEILKIRDGTPMEAEEILIYIKSPQRNRPSQEILKIRDVARILFFKIRPSQEILKIRDGTPLEAEEILIHIKKPSNKSVWHFSSKLDILSNVVQKKRVARILFFKIRPSQEILKIRHGTPLETEEILTYIKSPQNRSFWHFYSNLDVPSNVVHKKRVARNLFIKIRPSQEILKIRHGTPLETEEILTYIKSPQNRSFWHFYSNLDVPSNVVQKKRVARILFFKIRPSQEILKIRDVQNKRVARILVFKIRPSQEILKIRHGTPLETEEILTYIKSPQNRSFWHFYSNLDVPSNVVQKKRVARILFFKIRPSQEILKIRHGTPLETEEILTYIKSPQNRSFWHFYSNLDVPSNVVQKKRVARILFFKIRPSQEILKIRDDRKRVARILFFKIRPSQEILKIRDVARNLFIKIRPSQEILKIRDEILKILMSLVQKKIVAQILFFKIRPSQEILKIRDGTPLEAEEILIYIKKPSNKSVWHFSSNLDVPINVVQKKRVARILFSKIRPSQEILKIRDGTPLEAEEILIHIKKPSNKSVWHFSSKLDILSNVVQKKRVARILVFKIRPSQEILIIRDGTPLENKRVARILVFKIRPSQEILKIRHGTPLETEEILTYIKSPQNRSFWHFYSNLDVPSNVVQKKRVARILFFKIRPSQEILKIRHGTPLETEEILTYIKSPQNRSFWHFYSNLDVPSNVVQKKRVARILFFKIRPSQEILKIRDDPSNKSVWHFSSNLDVPTNVVQRKRVARILFFKIRPSQEILKIRDGTPMEAEEILIYIKSPQNKSVWHFSSNLYIPSNVVQKKRVARIMFFKIRPSQEILKIRDGTPMEAEEILIYIKKPSKKSVWHFSSNLDVPSNVVQKKIVARILFFKIRPSQEILKIRDGTPLEAEEILIYIKKPSNKSVWHFSSNLDVPINVVQKKRVARILFSKIRPSQEILKIRDGTPLEAEEILIHIKKPSNKSVWHFSSKLDILSNVVQKKRVARILFFKIRPSQEILKIRHGTPLETEEILTYIKSPQNRSFWHFYSNLDVPSNVVHKKRVARNLFIKIRPSQEILKIRDGTSLEMEEILTYIKKPSKQIEILKIRHGTPLETEEILTYIKSPQNRSFWHFYSNLDVPSNVVQKKRVARILFFKIRPSQEILKIRHGTPLETEEILTYIKSPQNRSFWHFYSNLDVPSNVVQKKRVARILFFKIRPSQEILKIRDGTSLETEEILT